MKYFVCVKYPFCSLLRQSLEDLTPIVSNAIKTKNIVKANQTRYTDSKPSHELQSKLTCWQYVLSFRKGIYQNKITKVQGNLCLNYTKYKDIYVYDKYFVHI